MKEKKSPTILIASVVFLALLAFQIMAMEIGKVILSPAVLDVKVTSAVYNDKINHLLGKKTNGFYKVSLSEAWDADQQGISLRKFDGCYDSYFDRQLNPICFDAIKVIHSGIRSGYLSKKTLATLDSDFGIELDAILVKRDIMKDKAKENDLKNETQNTNEIRIESKVAEIDRYKLISDISTFVAFKHMKCDNFNTAWPEYKSTYDIFDESLYGLTSKITCNAGRELIKNHLKNQQNSRMTINILSDITSD